METKEQKFYGDPAVPGTVVGKAHIYRRLQPAITEGKVPKDQVEEQLVRFHNVLDLAEKELRKLSESYSNSETEELLDAQIEIVSDPDLRHKVEEEIKKNHKPADAAIQEVFDQYIKLLEVRDAAESGTRAIEITDIRDRVIQLLNDNENKQIAEGTVVVARELSPREVIEFSRQEVKGLVMEQAGDGSHAVILARSLKIPTVVRIAQACDCIPQNSEVALDGSSGTLILNPLPERNEQFDECTTGTESDQSTQKNKTADGYPFELYANIGFRDELKGMHDTGACGIGLLRTELAYLDSGRLGSEQDQQMFYRHILQETDDKPVTIRLFDTGGDKMFDIGPQEPNPNLGWRGIRFLLDEEETLKQQLRAIFSVAGQYPGRIRLLVPMVSCLEEMVRIKEVVNSVSEDMKASGLAVDENMDLGIMVEVPAVAAQINSFVQEVDFLSIGTNDLTQYLLAADRGNDRISALYNQHHPVVWSFIDNIIQAGQTADIPVSVCGELAADSAGACALLGLGISTLSMAPASIPPVRKKLSSHRLQEMQELAKKLLEQNTAAETNELLTKF